MNATQNDFLELLDGSRQYVVPRWQRRYRWGQSEIERLMEDLLAVAEADHDSSHYGGALITFPEPDINPGSVVTTYRVVDGQQRLTTVSLLLARIAEVLGEDGRCGQWNADLIRHRLTNQGGLPGKRYKLRLQAGDDEEYRDVLKGIYTGTGAVTQAWRTIRRLVAKHDNNVCDLMRGLERLRVVSLALGDRDDAQQIFESLNATGRPLTESEKVKNWFLIGLSDSDQGRLYDECWVKIENALDAKHSSEKIDIFLRDLLRWWTGDLQGVDKVYEGLRRWAVKTGRTADRQQLLKDIVPLAKLYGVLTGARGNTGDQGKHPNKDVERRLRHLRATGIDVHRPFSLRLLHDADRKGVSFEATAKVLHYIGTWITRLWLADRPLGGLNRAMVRLAHNRGPDDSENYVDFWHQRIGALMDGRVAVPSDEEVREGVQTRRAYGAAATTTAFAVLCAIMEDEVGIDNSPARSKLTMEHVMPRKLTREWRHKLGDDAEDIHKMYLNRLANLTLIGADTNAVLGTRGFEAKKETYRKSSIGMTRRIAREGAWNEEIMDQRGSELADRALRLWEWEGPIRPLKRERSHFRWRIDNGEWRTAPTGNRTLLDVTSALLGRHPENGDKLLGTNTWTDLQRTSEVPETTRDQFRTIPGYSQYMMFPYTNIVSRSRKMGQRCGVSVEVEMVAVTDEDRFWQHLASEGGVPSQKWYWKGKFQWTDPLSRKGDKIQIGIGSDTLRVCIGIWGSGGPERYRLLLCYSRMIEERMADQQLDGHPEERARQGRTVIVQKPWNRSDEDDWSDAATWIKDQVDRLTKIAAAGRARHATDARPN